MNKRQIKKRVKRAKIKKERGLILSLEEQHFIRNYGTHYYTKNDVAYVVENWEEFTAAINGIVQGVCNAFAEVFQGWADALRRNGGAAE